MKQLAWKVTGLALSGVLTACGISDEGVGGGGGGGAAVAAPDAFATSVATIVATAPDDTDPVAVDAIVTTQPEDTDPDAVV